MFTFKAVVVVIVLYHLSPQNILLIYGIIRCELETIASYYKANLSLCVAIVKAKHIYFH